MLDEAAAAHRVGCRRSPQPRARAGRGRPVDAARADRRAGAAPARGGGRDRRGAPIRSPGRRPAGSRQRCCRSSYPPPPPGGRRRRPGGRLVVVTDGWCTGCNRPAPLRELERIVRDHGGVLVVDDTQAVGILGSRPGRAFGDGDGTRGWCGLAHAARLGRVAGQGVRRTAGRDHRRRATGRRLARGTAATGCTSPPTAADLAAAERGAARPGRERRSPAAAARAGAAAARRAAAGWDWRSGLPSRW